MATEEELGFAVQGWYDGVFMLSFLSLVWLVRLQVLLLPLQTGGSVPGDEPDLAFTLLHFPILSGVVEFDGCRWQKRYRMGPGREAGLPSGSCPVQ
jgi:hypothetical protein